MDRWQRSAIPFQRSSNARAFCLAPATPDRTCPMQALWPQEALKARAARPVQRNQQTRHKSTTHDSRPDSKPPLGFEIRESCLRLPCNR